MQGKNKENNFNVRKKKCRIIILECPWTSQNAPTAYMCAIIELHDLHLMIRT
ncbi:hypothetical protein Hanom_Chr14g01319221 [Helianthus anomalus]